MGDTCNVDGVEGVADSSFSYCCPLGCGQCRGEGCGSVPLIYVNASDTSATSSSAYCCTEAFNSPTTDFCDAEKGVYPPCLIPEGRDLGVPGL